MMKSQPEIASEAPMSAEITTYDEAHFVTYIRLLDASASGVSDDEMCRIILNIDPASARSALKSHLARARWMTTDGYRHLLKSPEN